MIFQLQALKTATKYTATESLKALFLDHFKIPAMNWPEMT
jgi:hypothetical protein